MRTHRINEDLSPVDSLKQQMAIEKQEHQASKDIIEQLTTALSLNLYEMGLIKGCPDEIDVLITVKSPIIKNTIIELTIKGHKESTDDIIKLVKDDANIF